MSENRRIARAAGQVGALTLASRITGLLRDAVTSYYFGAGPAADALISPETSTRVLTTGES